MWEFMAGLGWLREGTTYGILYKDYLRTSGKVLVDGVFLDIESPWVRL